MMLLGAPIILDIIFFVYLTPIADREPGDLQRARFVAPNLYRKASRYVRRRRSDGAIYACRAYVAVHGTRVGLCMGFAGDIFG